MKKSRGKTLVSTTNKQTNLISESVVIDEHVKDLGIVNVQQHPRHLASQVGIYGLENAIH